MPNLYPRKSYYSYFRDTIEFLERCSRVNHENTILATFDVVSLYTSIPHAYALEALSYWINKHPGSLHEIFNKQFVLESGKLIIKNNNCKFIDEFFVQINSTPMGTYLPLHMQR